MFPEAAGSFALALNLGLGSAVGSVGATFDYSRLGPLEVELGTGLGFTGVQASGMLKIGVWGTRTDRFVVGAGLAEIVSHYGSKVTGKPVWLNLDLLSYETRGVVFFSFAVGVTKGLGGGTFYFSDGGPNLVAGGTFPQIRFLMGGWGG